MVALVQATPLDLNDLAPDAARAAIRTLLAEDSRSTRRVYAALARKVWTLLVERRFDPEIRDWHVLLNNVRSKVQAADQPAAERMTALADLLRESLSFAELSPAVAVANRPRGRAILELLAKGPGFVKRRELMKELAIGSSNLSNVLTQLQVHDLIRRRGKGKEAEFEITRLGRALLKGQAEQAGLPMTLFEAKLLEELSKTKPTYPKAKIGQAFLDQLVWANLQPRSSAPDPLGYGQAMTKFIARDLVVYSSTPDPERLPALATWRP